MCIVPITLSLISIVNLHMYNVHVTLHVPLHVHVPLHLHVHICICMLNLPYIPIHQKVICYRVPCSLMNPICKKEEQMRDERKVTHV